MEKSEPTWNESEILAQAQQHTQQQKKKTFISDIQESLGFDKNLDYYDLLQYFDIQKDQLFNPELIRKIDTIYDWGKEKGDVLKSIGKLDIELGKPSLMDKVDKIYSHIFLINQEKSIKKPKDEIKELKKHIRGK